MYLYVNKNIKVKKNGSIDRTQNYKNNFKNFEK